MRRARYLSAELDTPRGDSEVGRRVVSGDPPVAADLWIQLRHPESSSIDLGEYAGLAFWVRLSGSTGEVLVAFNRMGRYFDGADADVSMTVIASEEWQQVLVRFDEVGVDATAIASFDFIVGTDGAAYDLWVDDVQLFCDGSCPAP